MHSPAGFVDLFTVERDRRGGPTDGRILPREKARIISLTATEHWNVDTALNSLELCEELVCVTYVN